MIPIVDCAIKMRPMPAIAELLEQHGVKTAGTVAEYGRIVLEGGKKRKRRKRAKTALGRKISGHARKVRRTWLKKQCRPLRRLLRAMLRFHQARILHTGHAGRTLPK